MCMFVPDAFRTKCLSNVLMFTAALGFFYSLICVRRCLLHTYLVQFLQASDTLGLLQKGDKTYGSTLHSIKQIDFFSFQINQGIFISLSSLKSYINRYFQSHIYKIVCLFVFLNFISVQTVIKKVYLEKNSVLLDGSSMCLIFKLKIYFLFRLKIYFLFQYISNVNFSIRRRIFG